MTGSPNIFKFWGKIDSVEAAASSAKIGSTGAYIVAAVTAAIVAANLLGFPIIPEIGVSSLLDVAFFAGLGFGISRHSRVCAVLALALYLFGQWTLAKTASTINGVMIAIFVVFFIHGIRGTFEFHKLKQRGANTDTAGA